jgi:uncharacterized protein YggE
VSASEITGACYPARAAVVSEPKELPNMQSALRVLLIPVAVALACSVAVVAVVVASNRQPILLTSPSASLSSTSFQPAILTSGDAIVSKKPDLAVVSAGIDSQQGTAAGAQADLANKAARLIARIKSLGVADKDLNTTGYWIGPMYAPGGQTVSGYRATEILQIKWHNVDTVGKTLDAIVQDGGATQINISFGLADPKSAQAEARSLAIADARAKAEAMAGAAGVKLGQVLLVSDQSTNTAYPASLKYAGAAAQADTQVPVGELDIQVTVEVDFAIA